MRVSSKIDKWAQRIRRDAFAVYYAAKDTRTPRYLRILAAVVVAYAVSPIDLIPDFIPILGYLDDLLIVPVGLLLVIRLLPEEVLIESRERASAQLADPTSFKHVAVVVGTWLLCIVMLILWWYAR